MKTLLALARDLRDLDGQGYPAYKGIRGRYDTAGYVLHVEHVQGDPFADPSRIRVDVPPATAGLPAWTVRTAARRRATADFLNRRLAAALRDASRPLGSGNSGELRVLRPGQEVLARASVEVDGDGAVRARLRAGLPARGRRIQGEAAAALLTESLPAAVEGALFYAALDPEALRTHVETVEDAVALREQLEPRGLVAFVADGAALPRRSGVDDRPLEAGVVPFDSPAALRVVLPAPHAGEVAGMGVPRGVTLIVGGGYHGKSTLLRALERGIYDHVPGDGRERVVTVRDAVKVRAEDGRRIAGVDISNFIGALPSGEDTRRFFTDNASGSTSQAAAIVEALELGAGVLLLDEDTSATNFMIRDARMQALIADEHEPITPFIDRARQLQDELAVSVVVVVGGSGDYFDVADTVVAMRNYRPEEVTEQARAVAATLATRRRPEGGAWRPLRGRRIDPASIDASRGKRASAIRVRSLDRVDFGEHLVDLGAVEQLVEVAQTRAVAHAAEWARDHAFQGTGGFPEALAAVLAEVARSGLPVVHPHAIGELAEFRIFELAAFLNRLRTLRLRELP
ncbi:MAG TPA: ABC-ATPase domain-containing protein [Longimicrobiales bacterium]|nr:ABC-ATPase domain-containing protein [Longimicrobiales bacterium]